MTHICENPPKFKVGDKVTFTNENEVVFTGKTITEVVLWCDGDYPNDYWRYHVTPTDTPWYPYKESHLSLEK